MPRWPATMIVVPSLNSGQVPSISGSVGLSPVGVGIIELPPAPAVISVPPEPAGAPDAPRPAGILLGIIAVSSLEQLPLRTNSAAENPLIAAFQLASIDISSNPPLLR